MSCSFNFVFVKAMMVRTSRFPYILYTVYIGSVSFMTFATFAVDSMLLQLLTFSTQTGLFCQVHQ